MCDLANVRFIASRNSRSTAFSIHYCPNIAMKAPCIKSEWSAEQKAMWKKKGQELSPLWSKTIVPVRHLRSRICFIFIVSNWWQPTSFISSFLTISISYTPKIGPYDHFIRHLEKNWHPCGKILQSMNIHRNMNWRTAYYITSLKFGYLIYSVISTVVE